MDTTYQQDYYAAHREQRKREATEWRRSDHGMKLRAKARMKARAARQGWAFDLAYEDIPDPPTHCPILGIPLVRGGSRNGSGPSDDSPTIDRIDPSLGYVKGNIIWLSNRANRLKADIGPETVHELQKVMDWILTNG